MTRAIDLFTFMAGPAGHDWMRTFKGRVYLTKVYLNRQGYTSSGVYYGYCKGEHLYYINAEGECNENGEFYDYEDCFRATNRDEAKAVARELFPNGKIRY